MYTDYFWLVSFQVQFRVMNFCCCFFFGNVVSQKPLRRAKRTKFGLLRKVEGTLDCVHIQCGVIWCIPDLWLSFISETAVRRAKRTQNLGLLSKYLVYTGTFDYQGFMFSLGLFCVFPIFGNLLSQNRWSQSEMDQNLDFWGKYLVYTGYFWLLSVQGQFRVIPCISYFSEPNVFPKHLVLKNRNSWSWSKQSKIWASWAKSLVYFDY